MRFSFTTLVASVFFVATSHAGVKDPYPTCTPTNDYLEASLSAASVIDFSLVCEGISTGDAPKKFSELERFGRSLQLPPECIRAAQQLTPEPAYRWGACAQDKRGNKWLTTAGLKRPCQSESYHFFVYVSYLEAMNCLGIDPRTLVGLFTLESNFQVNIGSNTGAWGVGQLTTVAVSITNKMKRLDPLKDKPECASLRPLLDKPFSPKNSCEWITTPANPTLNFLYAGMGYLTFRAIAKGWVTKSKTFSKMNEADKERSITDITRYLYNGGDGGVLPALKAYIVETGAKPLTYPVFQAGFREYLKHNYGTSVDYYKDKTERLAAKRLEVAGYAAGVDSALKIAEKGGGNEMFALITLLIISSAHADSASELVASIASHKKELAAAQSLPEKLTGLRALKLDLDNAARALSASELNVDERRRLIFTTEALRIYFGYLNEKRIRAGQCGLIRDQIHYAIDPRNSPPARMPGEALEALEVLDLVCAQKGAS